MTALVNPRLGDDLLAAARSLAEPVEGGEEQAAGFLERPLGENAVRLDRVDGGGTLGEDTGEEHDRRGGEIGILPEERHDLAATDPGHDQVDDREIRGLLHGLVDPLEAIGGLIDAVAVRQQLARERLQEPLVVIDEEHPFHWSPFALIVNVGPCSVDSERAQVQEPSVRTVHDCRRSSPRAPCHCDLEAVTAPGPSYLAFGATSYPGQTQVVCPARSRES